MRRWRRG